MTHPALAEHAHYLNALTPEGEGTPSPDEMVVRVSTVGSADLCPARVYLRQEKGSGYDDRPGEVLVFGTLVHALIQRLTEDPSPIGSAYLGATGILVLDDEYPHGWSIDGLFGSQARYFDWLGEAMDMAQAWKKWARTTLGWPLPEPRHVEQPMAAWTGSLWLAGTPDLLLPSMGLGLDWKTSNKGWPASRAAGQNQHHAYRWLARQVLGLDLGEWWFVVGNRSNQTWQEHRAVPSDDGMRGFLARLEGLADSLASGCTTFMPKDMNGRRAWWCTPTYCPAWEVCDGRLLGDDKDHAQREDLVLGWPGLT